MTGFHEGGSEAARPTRRLLACDLDGTVIPADATPESQRRVDRWGEVVAAAGLPIAYLTGRHLELALRGIERFGLPAPVALACDVGTSVYRPFDGRWARDDDYAEALAATPGFVPASAVRDALADAPGLSLQEANRQTDLKASYYVDGGAGRDAVAARLAPLGRTRLVYSRDPRTGQGLLDVLPDAAGKRSALHFLAERLSDGPDDVIYAGDSGNDRDALLCGVRAIVVGNAPTDFRESIRRDAARRGLEHRVLLAASPLSTGVLEGLRHFSWVD